MSGRHYCLSVSEPLRNPLQSPLLSYFLLVSTSCTGTPLLPNATSTPSFHCFRGWVAGLFSSGFHIKYLLGFLFSSILITCPYHLNLVCSISSNNGGTCTFALMVVFLILSFHVTPFIILSTHISAACNLTLFLWSMTRHLSQAAIWVSV